MGFEPSGLHDTLEAWGAAEADDPERVTQAIYAFMDIAQAPDRQPGAVRRALADTPFFKYTVGLDGLDLIVAYIVYPEDDHETGRVSFLRLRDLRTDTTYGFGIGETPTLD